MLETEEEALTGEPLEVAGTADFAGKARVELVRRRESVSRPKTERTTAEDYKRDYDAARNRVAAFVEVEVTAGPFAVSLPDLVLLPI